MGLSGVRDTDSVLDIATGGGFLALEFARHAREVTGVDLTPRMLERAELLKAGAGIDNVRFRTADVENLPFPDGSFDIVSCRFAFHHFPDPEKAVSEMVRVAKAGARVVMVDGVAPEEEAKRELMNGIERLRDPSHVKIYALSEMKGFLKGAGLTLLKLKHWPLEQDLEDWIARAGPDPGTAEAVREAMLASMGDDGTGLNLRQEGGRMVFTYDTVIMVAMK
ncbi:MAG: class I SAM-dependent methyltransferase [Euryarchaeota archaeon]|nr:class I SAM-dependent methyltransferase [Euryarchaeota archaeon]